MTDGNRVPTGNLKFLSPAGRHCGTRVPTGFRVSESHIPRKQWGSAPKMARVCPLSAELRLLLADGTAVANPTRASSTTRASKRRHRQRDPAFRGGGARGPPRHAVA
jgi:hypothetical protein